MKVRQLMSRKQFLEECEYAATLIAELAEEIRRGEWESFTWDEQFSRARRKAFSLQLERSGIEEP